VEFNIFTELDLDDHLFINGHLLFCKPLCPSNDPGGCTNSKGTEEIDAAMSVYRFDCFPFCISLSKDMASIMVSSFCDH